MLGRDVARLEKMMEVRFIGGIAEGLTVELPDEATTHVYTRGDGTTERYVMHYAFEVGDPRSGGGMSKFAYFAPDGMSMDQVLARAGELFDDPDEV